MYPKTKGSSVSMAAARDVALNRGIEITSKNPTGIASGTRANQTIPYMPVPTTSAMAETAAVMVVTKRAIEISPSGVVLRFERWMSDRSFGILPERLLAGPENIRKQKATNLSKPLRRGAGFSVTRGQRRITMDA